MKKTIIFLVLTIVTSSIFAQDAIDTVVIKVGDGSKVIFAIKDKKDLETMKKYNFQKLMDDMIYKLEIRDSSRLNRLSSEFLKKDSVKENIAQTPTETKEPERVSIVHHDRKYYHRTRNSFNVDIGTNNFLNGGGNFPNQGSDLYAVKPWGSWYV